MKYIPTTEKLFFQDLADEVILLDKNNLDIQDLKNVYNEFEKKSSKTFKEFYNKIILFICQYKH